MKIKNKVSAKLYGTAMLSSVLLFSQCKKEQENQPISMEEQVSLNGSLDKLAASSSSISSDAYRIEEALPKGYVKNASVDYTSYIQKAINNNKTLVFPNFPILINDGGLRIPSNRTIYFLEGSEIRLKPSSKQNYYILDVRLASNVKLISPVIKGDRTTHRGNTGEWGMGIAIRGSSNVTVTNAKVYDCWGDGIYIDSYNGTNSKNITISEVECKYNRRDGMSVCSVDGLLIENSYFGYSAGTAPMVGINFEPNDPKSRFNNVKIRNVRTEYNKGYGIQIVLGKMFGDGVDKNVSFDFQNFMDKGSNIGMKVSCWDSKRKPGEEISGKIKLDIPFWRLNSERAFKTNIAEKDLKIYITRPKVTLKSGEYITGSKAESYLFVKGNVNPTAKDLKLVMVN